MNEGYLCARAGKHILDQFGQMAQLLPAGKTTVAYLSEECRKLAGDDARSENAGLPRLWAAARAKPALIAAVLPLQMALTAALPPLVLVEFMDEMCKLLKVMSEPDFESPGAKERREGGDGGRQVVLEEDLGYLRRELAKIQSKLQDSLLKQNRLSEEERAPPQERAKQHERAPQHQSRGGGGGPPPQQPQQAPRGGNQGPKGGCFKCKGPHYATECPGPAAEAAGHGAPSGEAAGRGAPSGEAAAAPRRE